MARCSGIFSAVVQSQKWFDLWTAYIARYSRSFHRCWFEHHLAGVCTVSTESQQCRALICIRRTPMHLCANPNPNWIAHDDVDSFTPLWKTFPSAHTVYYNFLLLFCRTESSHRDKEMHLQVVQHRMNSVQMTERQPNYSHQVFLRQICACFCHLQVDYLLITIGLGGRWWMHPQCADLCEVSLLFGAALWTSFGASGRGMTDFGTCYITPPTNSHTLWLIWMHHQHIFEWVNVCVAYVRRAYHIAADEYIFPFSVTMNTIIVSRAIHSECKQQPQEQRKEKKIM